MDIRPLVSVVDDDESVRESLPDLLREFGFSAQAFSCAEEFLESGNAGDTRCLILDVAMPGISGPELQRELTRRSYRVPIIFITAHRDESIRSRVLAQGAVRCLFKPFTDTALLDAIHAALRASEVVRSSTEPIVFVVDDDISVGESLETLIRAEGWQPETFSSASAFFRRERVNVPSCLVLDVSLPDLNGLDVQKRVVDRQDMPIIFITGHGDIPTSVKAMKAGAVEFLTKPFAPEALLTAIRNALERSRIALENEAELQSLRASYASLTPREQEVMALIVAGLLNKQAGDDLGITEITVKAHRAKVMQKMKASSFAQLVTMATRLGIGPR